MTPLLLALLAGPAEARPLDLSGWQGVEVSYVMKTQGTLTCQTTFQGSGASPKVVGDAITFEGTWKIVADSCQGKTVWAPEDGTAFHTLRLGKGGKSVDEWIVHDKAGDSTRFLSDISARGQFWINELAATPDGSGAFRYSTSEEQGMFPLKITIEHTLEVKLLATAPEAPASEPVEHAPEGAPEEPGPDEPSTDEAPAE